MVQKDGPVGTFREYRLIQFAGQKFRENWKLFVRHVTGWDKDYLRKIPSVVW